MNLRFRTVLKNVALFVLIAGLFIETVVLIQNTRIIQQLRPLAETLDMIEKQSYTNQHDRTALVEQAISGLLTRIGDGYAQYYSEEEYAMYLEELSGTYHGVGILVGQSNDMGVPVLQVYEGSPAEQAGLIPGDIITHVDGAPLHNMPLEEIAQLFTGEDGSAVHVDIARGEELLAYDIVRGEGRTTRVEYKLLPEDIGYVRIDKFSGTVTEEFTEALQVLTQQGMKCLIIDLRDNPGGELEKVVAVSDAMLKEGNIVSVRYTDGQENMYTSDKQALTEVPLAVLVNENSASASEIFAAAMQDNVRGSVVGLPTYGKGVVQTTAALASNGGWVKLTTAAYYTPTGKSVEKIGVLPDIEADLNDTPLSEIPAVLMDHNLFSYR